MKEKPNYYAIIPAEVRYSKALTPNAKLLYAEITALCNMNGKCTASTEYFCRLYEVSRGAVQNWLKMLDDNGYIQRTVIYKQGTKQIMHRFINLKDKGSVKIMTDNTNINIINTNLTDSNKKALFKKPTLDEVKNYCILRKNNIEAESFIDFYESKDWLIGKNKMKDWKACVRTWESREKKNPKSNSKGMSKIHQHLQKNINVKEKLLKQFNNEIN
jgi:DNA-binding transcriptional regulator YiaG